MGKREPEDGDMPTPKRLASGEASFYDEQIGEQSMPVSSAPSLGRVIIPECRSELTTREVLLTHGQGNLRVFVCCLVTYHKQMIVGEILAMACGLCNECQLAKLPSPTLDDNPAPARLLTQIARPSEAGRNL